MVRSSIQWRLKPLMRVLSLLPLATVHQACGPADAVPVSGVQSGVGAIDFKNEIYLAEICSQDLQPYPFRAFSSSEYIYDAPKTVVVNGNFAEMRSADAASAATIYDEVSFTLFQNIKIEVLSEAFMPDFAFDKVKVEFAVSEHPFFSNRQIKYQRAMGADFPLLPLSSLEESSDPSQNFDANFISVINVIRSGSASADVTSSHVANSEQIRQDRHVATGTNFVRSDKRFLEIHDLVGAKYKSSKLILSRRGDFLVIQVQDAPKIVIALSISSDRVGILRCGG
jgi:hypothetical protein